MEITKNKAKILIVEDEVIIADHIFELLQKMGYNAIEPALTYSEAINKIDQFCPDIAIIDIKLSGRLSGIDLAKKINEEYKFPFIYLTSSSGQETFDELKITNPSSYLLKPISGDRLFSEIELALYSIEKRTI
jgi:two-component SAPR family response regulator